MEDKSRICNICNRIFANGKAMGGHMRSHLAKLPVPVAKIHVKAPSKPVEKTASTDDGSATTPAQSPPSITSATLQHAPPSPKEQSLNQSDHMSVQDRESDTEYLKRSPTCKRSKRHTQKKEIRQDESVMKKSNNTAVVHENEQISSVSETFSDEDIALCLLMLSGKRKRRSVVKDIGDGFDNNKRRKILVAKEEDEDLHRSDSLSNSSDEDEDNHLDDDSYVGRKVRARYRCETCKKVFKSHQALGGHKASHNHKKMMQTRAQGDANNPDTKDGGVNYKRVFECEFCGKVFETGQGLGGHKKIHLFYARKYKNDNNDDAAPKLDLNLPPAPEDEEEVMSQVVQS